MKKGNEPKNLREDKIGNTSIKLLRGDVTRLNGGIIINPTDSSLTKLPGISTTIVEGAGHQLLKELSLKCREGFEILPGEIVTTTAGNLGATRLCHICIPQYNKNDPEPLVRMFIVNLLNHAEQYQTDSIILPCLTKETNGFTPEQCAFGYYSTLIDFINTHPQTCLREFKIVCKNKKESKPFEKEADRRLGKKEKKSMFGFMKKFTKTKSKTEKEILDIELGGNEERKNN
ncbi:hypothetical protein SteCoe_22672 [Stentor coeruleus]|uniref:Macro domain-containing protein n=1 Tax=Stentor coeruleus TaxID=5963 RepID=A0A1R2BLH7_9CILI|nr:hypothetical protein SteCoe_22672 [Stentor coeruleus]